MSEHTEIRIFGAGGAFLALLGMTGVLFSLALPSLLLPSLLFLLLGVGGLLVSLYLISTSYGRGGFVRDFAVALTSPLLGLLIAPSLAIYAMVSFFLSPLLSLALLGTLLIALPFLLGILPAFLLFRTFGSVRETTGESLFRAAAIFSLLAFLSLALVVTAPLFVVFTISSLIVLTVAFSRLRPPQSAETSLPSSSSPQVSSGSPQQPPA
ncbi:MAG: hypothetical protein N3D79_02365 [Acidilobaceae archaeon]|nr:hypothetical protein [Acidilobaceae archaeon]